MNDVPENQSLDTGTNAPENLENDTPTGSPETKQDDGVLDFDTAKKVRFEGHEWTPQDFRKAVMFQSDYTRKTQAIAEERRYYDNLSADLDKVRERPDLAAEFQKTYPEKFHSYLRYVLKEEAKKQGAEETPANDHYKRLEAKVNSLESEYHERKVAAIEAELDSKFKTLSQKYKYADEETALVRADALLNKLRSESPQGKRVELTDEHWDRIWKSVDDANKKRAEEYYKERTGKIKSANFAGKDSAAGGGIPGNAPRAPKTIKEASKYALEELENS